LINTEKKRILQVVHSLRYGGVSTVVSGLAEGLSSEFNSYVYVLKSAKNEVKINKARVIKSSINSKFILSSLKEFISIIDKYQINIVHFQAYPFFMCYAFVVKLYRPRVKIIFHLHAYLSNGDSFYERVLLRLMVFIFKNSVSRFITVSNSQRSEFIDLCRIDSSKIIAIHNFVKILPNIKSGNKLNRNFTVGFAGRIIKTKGWEEFVNLAILLKNDNRFQFKIAGDGKDYKKLVNLISSNNLTNIKSLGYIKNIDLFYDSIDCLVLPSYFETMGLTALEAQANGVPVICSNIPGLDEVTSNGINVLTFNIKNIEQMKKNIIMIYTDLDIRRKLIMNGQKNVSQYTIKNYIQQIVKIYNL